MTASVHKLTAGCGYDYLTRQVAAHDTTEKGHATLASYYSERGETPGTWYGRGLTGLGDLAVGDEVTQEQMQALFAHGHHPNMKARLAGLPAGASTELVEHATLLGQPFKTFEAATQFRLEGEKRSTRWRASQGLAPTAPVPVEVRAEIVNRLAEERFQERIGRAPTAGELAAEVARWSRSPTTACAGYDITFTPVKSVSTLWAIAPKPIAALIEQAHDAAVDDALAYLEDHALYSRAGRNGVRQIDVHGLIAARFKHRDSRAGDPNLHTHVAIANKVQAIDDGKWRSIDGRLIFKAMVSVSETYNTQLEAHLHRLRGIQFAQRPGGGRDKRPVREIVGVPAELRELWSSRRAVIEVRQAQLAAEFQTRHGRPPTPAEAIRLAQQATLETRQAKHEPRSLDEQRATWHEEAEHVLGPHGINQMLRASVGRAPRREPAPSDEVLHRMAVEVVETIAQTRSTWQVWHLRAEASRRARELTPTTAESITQQLVDRALAVSIPLNSHNDGITEPPELRRKDGTSMYEVAGSRLFTSQAVIDAEHQILHAASRTGGRVAPADVVEIALLEAVANGTTLTDGQANLVRTLATSGHPVQLALAAAGTGKTTAMRVLGRAWEESGGTVLGLAPSAAAAAVLADEIGQATTVAKLLWELERGNRSDVDKVVTDSTLIILDEAGMTDTLSLARLINYATSRGASIRLVGDDRQLAAIGAGGVLRDIHRTHGAVILDEVLRFTDDGEKIATTALRDGDPAALGWYLDHDRIHAGSREAAIEGVLTAWLTETQAGQDSLMLAGARGDVADLNRRAQHHLTPGAHHLIPLADGNTAGIGDLVLTRRNDRRMRVSATDWVKNGDRWIIESITPSGAIGVRRRITGLRATLPTQYVAEHVELGYATTVHTAQGITVDTTHTIITGTETREQLYVAATRGRTENHLWIPVVGGGDEHTAFTPTTLRPPTAIDILEAVLARDTAARSVTTELTHHTTAVAQLPDAVTRYHDAVTVALEHHHATRLADLDAHADDVVPGVTASDAWPTLRQRLLHTSTGTPLDELRRIAVGHAWDQVRDPAALLAASIEEPRGGPLPWLPPIPQALGADEKWAPYLQARANRVSDLATQVRSETSNAPLPSWMPVKDHISDSLVGDLRVWRAAMAIDPTDQRPTGPPLPPGAARRHQETLDAQLIPQTSTYGVVQLRRLGQGLDHDPITLLLAQDLAQLEARRLPVGELLTTALEQGPLPAELPAAALRWRIKQLAKDQPEKDRDGERWKKWAATVNPDLITSPHWPTIQGLLTNLQDRIDLDKAATAWKDHTPLEIRAALFRIRTPLTAPASPKSREVQLQQRRHYPTTTRRPEAPSR